MRRIFFLLSVFSINFYFLLETKEAKAGCAEFEAKVWTINKLNGSRSKASNGFIYECANQFTFSSGAESTEFKAKYWSCVSKQGCSGNFKQGYSAMKLNDGKWLPVKGFKQNRSNGLRDQTVCVQQEGSFTEYCWKQGKSFCWTCL
tara:strand:+ start:100 stop:537 length:438 start_codon:yes stop_codon:yes gene_type:complete